MGGKTIKHITLSRYPEKSSVQSTDKCPRCGVQTKVELMYAAVGGVFFLDSHIGGENVNCIVCTKCGLNWITGTLAVVCIKAGHFSWRDNLLYSELEGQLRGEEYGVDVKTLNANKVNTPLPENLLEKLEKEFEDSYDSGGNDPCGSR